MSKRISMTARPKTNPGADQWVEKAEPSAARPPKPKRLTIDIDPTLHKRLKLYCFQQDIVMADLLRDLIEQKLGVD